MVGAKDGDKVGEMLETREGTEVGEFDGLEVGLDRNVVGDLAGDATEAPVGLREDDRFCRGG